MSPYDSPEEDTSFEDKVILSLYLYLFEHEHNNCNEVKA